MAFFGFWMKFSFHSDRSRLFCRKLFSKFSNLKLKNNDRIQENHDYLTYF